MLEGKLAEPMVRDQHLEQAAGLSHPRLGSKKQDSHPALMLVKLQTDGVILLARLTRRSAEQLGLAPGREVYLQIKAVAVL